MKNHLYEDFRLKNARDSVKYKFQMNNYFGVNIFSFAIFMQRTQMGKTETKHILSPLNCI